MDLTISSILNNSNNSNNNNNTIRSKMQAEQSILDGIQTKQLKWYGHLLRMEDGRWPKKIYQGTPHGRRIRGRPQKS